MKNLNYYHHFIISCCTNTTTWIHINNFKNVYTKIFLKIIILIPLYVILFFKHFCLLSKQKLYLPYLEIVITTKCSLNCEKCSNFIPLFSNKEKVDSNLIKNIKLLKIFDYIDTIRILGGEPLLNNNLNIIINEISKLKISNKIVIVTNGTITKLPTNLVETIKNRKVSFYVSDYKISQTKKLIKFLNKEKINYYFSNIKFWYNFGNGKRKEKSIKELTTQRQNCNVICKSYFNGKIFNCPQSSSLFHLGYTSNKEIYLDLTKEISKEEIRKFLSDKSILEACSYCNKGTKDFKKIDVAKQKNKY